MINLRLFFALILLSCCGRDSEAQPDLFQLTKAQWTEDIRYLQKQWTKKHANLFHTMQPTQFQKTMNDLLEKLDKLTANEIMVELVKIGAMVKDGHTDVQPVSLRYSPRFASFQGSIYITSAPQEFSHLVGGRVLKVEGMPIDEVTKRLIPLVDGDNEMEVPRKVPDFLAMASVLQGLHIVKSIDAATFTILTDQNVEVEAMFKPSTSNTQEKRVTLLGKANVPLPLYMQNVQRNYWYSYLKDSKTIYFQYNSCNDQKGEKSISAFADELFSMVDKNQIDYFIVDLRHNPGGNFLKSKPLVEGIKSRSSINQKGKLYVLTSRNTGSAATVTGAQLKTSTQAILVGELSRANPNFTYNAETFTLPISKLVVGYTESFHNPFPQLGKSLAVDIPVEITFEQFRQGKDPLLEMFLKVGK